VGVDFLASEVLCGWCGGIRILAVGGGGCGDLGRRIGEGGWGGLVKVVGGQGAGGCGLEDVVGVDAV